MMKNGKISFNNVDAIKVRLNGSENFKLLSKEHENRTPNVRTNTEKIEIIAFDEEIKLPYKIGEYILFLNSEFNQTNDPVECKLKNNSIVKAHISKICNCSDNKLILIKLLDDFIHLDIENDTILFITDAAVSNSSRHYLMYSPGDDDPPLPKQPLSSVNNGIESMKGSITNNKLNVYKYLEKSITVERPNSPVVAIMDTGINLFYWKNYKCPLYKMDGDKCKMTENEIYGWNFVEGSEGYQERPFDDDEVNQHGTRIAKIIANTTNSNVQLMILKTFDYQGSASFFDIFCAFEFILKQKVVNIINASWGYYGNPFSLFTEYIKRITEDKIWFINAAGNSTDFGTEVGRNKPRDIGGLDENGDGGDLKRYPACYSEEFDKVVTITSIKRNAPASSFAEGIPRPLYEPVENFSDKFVNAGIGAGLDGEFADPISDYDTVTFMGIKQKDMTPSIKGSSYATPYFVSFLVNSFNLLKDLPKRQVVQAICDGAGVDIDIKNNQLRVVDTFL